MSSLCKISYLGHSRFSDKIGNDFQQNQDRHLDRELGVAFKIESGLLNPTGQFYIQFNAVIVCHVTMRMSLKEIENVSCLRIKKTEINKNYTLISCRQEGFILFCLRSQIKQG